MLKRFLIMDGNPDAIKKIRIKYINKISRLLINLGKQSYMDDKQLLPLLYNVWTLGKGCE